MVTTQPLFKQSTKNFNPGYEYPVVISIITAIEAKNQTWKQRISQ